MVILFQFSLDTYIYTLDIKLSGRVQIYFSPIKSYTDISLNTMVILHLFKNLGL